MVTAVRFLTATAIVASLGLASAAQQARDAPAAAAAGTGVISGVVVSAETGAQPIRRAIVTISGDPSGSRSALTDDAGRFTIGRLPVGRFTITATKTAYLPIQYGASRPGRTGTQVALAADQRATVALKLTRGAVVTGVVKDRSGQPAGGVSVAVMDLEAVGQGSTPSPFLSSDGLSNTTDDRGVYRIFGLMPGEYAIVASPRILGTGPIGAASAAEMDAILAELTRRNTMAATTTGVTSSAPAPIPPAPAFGFAPTYYPGTAIQREAGTVRLGPAEERSGLDFQLTPIRLATLEGVLTGDASGVAAARMSIALEGQRGISSSILNPTMSQSPDRDGRFKITNMAPGLYHLTARSQTLFAAADIEIRGQDVAGVTLTLLPGGTFAGRIQVDSTATPPADLTKFRVGLSIPGGTYSMTGDANQLVIGNSLHAVPAVALKPDGTFEIPSVGPDSYVLALLPPAELGRTWWLRSAMLGGRDLLDGPVQCAPGSATTGVVLTVTDRRNELTGQLLTQAGAPMSDFFIIVFPADRGLWKAGARRIKSTRPGTDGAD
jgi:carboxypeptidase family protein